VTWRLALAAGLAASSWPSLASANASEAGEHAGDIGGVVMAVLIVTGAYLLARLVVDRLQRRFMVVSGAEYLMLGLLLGPLSPRLHAVDDLTFAMPFIALTAGWVGLLRGTTMTTKELSSLPLGTGRIVVWHHLVPGVLVGLAAQYFLAHGAHWPLFASALPAHVPWREVAISAAVLGCCAAADSTEPFDLLARRYRVIGETAAGLRRAAHLGDVLIIFVFGVLFCVYHRDEPGAALSLTATEWSVVSLVLGGVLGALFTPFVGGQGSSNSRFLALVGIIAFASGAAYFLDISPLLVNLALGVVLLHTTHEAKRLRDTLANTEPPMRIVLLVIAGALLEPVPWLPTIVLFVGFVALRAFGKFGASLIISVGTPLRRDLYRGLLAHGEVTLAMAVSFRVVWKGPVADMAYAVVLASIVLHDLVAPRLLRGLLRDLGEISEHPAEPEALATEATEAGEPSVADAPAEAADLGASTGTPEPVEGVS